MWRAKVRCRDFMPLIWIVTHRKTPRNSHELNPKVPRTQPATPTDFSRNFKKPYYSPFFRQNKNNSSLLTNRHNALTSNTIRGEELVRSQKPLLTQLTHWHSVYYIPKVRSEELTPKFFRKDRSFLSSGCNQMISSIAYTTASPDKHRHSQHFGVGCRQIA